MSSPSYRAAASPLATFMENIPLLDIAPTLNYTWTIAGVLGVLAWLVYKSTKKSAVYSIPAVGNPGPLASYADAIRFVKHGNEVLQEGYNKYYPNAFRFAEVSRWHVAITGEKMIEELRKAKDDELSFQEAVRESLASDYTLGKNVSDNQYHVAIVRGRLTRNLGNLFGDVREELALAFDTFIPPTEDWTRVKALETIQQIVSRTSNRIFVGAPLCRDLDFIKLNIQFTIDVAIGAQILYLFPDILKPIAGRLFTNVPASIRRGMKHLKPVIEERRRLRETLGDEYEMPNDMLTWLMEEAEGEETSIRNLTLRILTLNFAAIHTSSMTFTHALYALAADPAAQLAIREEVTSVIEQDGWNKVAMTRMRKLDSLIKESLRIMGLGAIGLSRKALKPFTFSDGTHIPVGTFVSVVSTARHLDEEIYGLDAREFKGFRFSDKREEEGEGTKNQMVATSADYLTFGLGKHACPGRFFAANELKGMMAHIVLTYDVMLDTEPKAVWFGPAVLPDSKAEVLFRKRR